ncbi:hypothetical protein SAMN04489740_2543 [Arthrobacter alpinus]|uniref:Uncharacterized protein n=1 Tax=Arthrobacter alpinus TaxID=656366 RepID=A0A1H5LQR3_9MICC|nr:hypothetical protein [Arthrobacter alpinus]SEE78857.1 hypothetical protein SAMN04489740_2543 [Arthrobacter alpinus]
MTKSGDFQQEVLSALNNSSPQSVITGVETAVAEKLIELDERVDVVFTDYFNHSYMPDMVLTWKEGGKRKERPLFVRTDTDPAGIAADIHGLITRSPLIIAVDEHSSGQVAREAIQVEQKIKRVDLLITDTSSLQTLTPRGGNLTNGYDFSKLVGQNFLSGGRGYIGQHEAATISSASVLSDASESFEEFDSAIDQFFMEDAALRLKRSTGLVRDVMRGNFAELSLAGQFSQAELRTVLPLLLGNPDARETQHLWEELGDVMSLSDLFDIAVDLETLDVSPLLNANITKWTAKRSQVVMNMASPSEVAAGRAGDSEGHQPDEEPLWKLWRGLVALDVKDWRILFADDARKLKGRMSGGTIPQWEQLAEILPSFKIKAVDLHGLSRRVSISAEKSGDIYGDISSVTDALDESFYVPRIQIQNSLESDESTTLVEFSEMLVTSSSSDTLASHARASIRLLLHNRITDTSELDARVISALDKSDYDSPEFDQTIEIDEYDS